MTACRTWAEWEALTGEDALTKPERDLATKCRDGQPCRLGDGTRPKRHHPARVIRAEFLRYLILGGCDGCRVAETGVQLQGAYIRGALGLDFATAKGQTSLVYCTFEDKISALQSRFEVLNLSGSRLPGLNAHGAQVAGHVILRAPFISNGRISLSGAQIGGQLSCSGGRFANLGGTALLAENADVKGSVILGDGFSAKGEVSLSGARIGGELACAGGRFENAGDKALNVQSVIVTGNVIFGSGFSAKGKVSLAGAKISGQLSCIGGKFENEGGIALSAQGASITDAVFLSSGFSAKGEVRLSGTQIRGQLDCSGGLFENDDSAALNAQRLNVAASFFWRGVSVPSGSVVLQAAHVGDLVDDPESWPGDGRLHVDGFTYDRIGAAFTDADRRKEWLEKGNLWMGDFLPQPYTQLAKVLREMGHDRAAREVMIEKERLLAQEQIKADLLKARALWTGDPSQRGDIGGHWLRRHLFRLWDTLIRNLVGYGYAPQRALYWAAGMLIFLTAFYFVLWRAGGMVPNSAVVLTSGDWAKAMASDAIATGRFWAETSPSAAHYETFWAGFYAADAFIPLINFGQEAAWTATTRNVAGWVAFIVTFLSKGFGWFITALGAAAVGGIIRRE